MQPRVSVIVLTYNARRFIERCLTELFNQHYPDMEVLVVDNASADGTADFVRQRFPDARVIASAINGGYGAGNNLGAAHASGEILAFLNPDAIPEHDWLVNLIGAMQATRRQFATSRIVLQSDRARLNSGGNLIHFLGLSFCRGLNVHRECFDHQELVSGASGAACAIRRSLFEQIGGFDPTFFLYHDDVDLSLRARLAGEPCLYVPDAVVAHDYSLKLQPAKWAWVEAHRYAVLLKTYRWPTLLLLVPGLLLVDLVTLAYLARQGPDYVRAKLASYGWVVRHWRSILQARRRAQLLRAVPDRSLIGSLVDRIPFEQLGGPKLAMLADALLGGVFVGYRRLMLSIVRW